MKSSNPRRCHSPLGFFSLCFSSEDFSLVRFSQVNPDRLQHNKHFTEIGICAILLTVLHNKNKVSAAVVNPTLAQYLI